MERALRIVLTLGFAWAVLKGVDIMHRSESVDRLLFQESGLSWLFWSLVPLIIVLLIVAVFSLWFPSAFGYRLAQAAVLLLLLESLIGGVLGIRNPVLLRQAYMASRAERGLPVRQELLELMGSPIMQGFSIAFPVLLSAAALVMLFLIERSRRARSVE